MATNKQEIDLLLKDIYEYLNRNAQELALSPEDRKLVQELIERSKKALTPTTENRLSVSTSNSPVDGNPTVLAEGTLSEFQQQTSTSKTICPFKSQPARELPNGIKRGALSMRRKLFTIDRLSKVFGAVQENWLLLYWTQKHVKPFRSFDLEMYQAKGDLNIPRNEDSREHCKTHSSFTLFSSILPNKNYNFVALTHDDMLQWVANINECHERFLKIEGHVGEHNYEDLKYTEIMDQESIYTEINNKPMPAYEDLDEIKRAPPKLPAKSTILFQPSKIDYNDQVLFGIVKSHSKRSSDSIKFSEDSEQPYDDIAVVVDELEDRSHLVTGSQLNIKEFIIEGHGTVQRFLSSLDHQNIEIEENAFQPDENYIEISSINCEGTDLKSQVLEAEKIDDSLSTSSHFALNETYSLKYDKLTNTDNEIGAEPNKNQFNKVWSNLKKNAQNKYLKRPSSNNTSLTAKTSTSNQTSNIIKIIRQKFVQKEYPVCSLETFSKSSKLETFQARPQSNNCNEMNNLKYNNST